MDAQRALLEAFVRKIGYTFRQAELLREALTHRSHGTPNNERLEFIGDSVLNCATAIALFNRFPRLPEGDLSRLRANLVNKNVLFDLAEPLGMGDVLRLGEGELKSGGHRRPSILADALEAVIGAVYLDNGFDAAAALVNRLLATRLDGLDPKQPGKDAKTLLQEFLQGKRLPLPRYNVVAIRGEAHEQTFRVACEVDDLAVRSEGEGNSRRAAEQAAAALALEKLHHG